MGAPSRSATGSRPADTNFYACSSRRRIRLQADCSSEVLAMGASLQIGIVVFKRRYPYWSSTPGLKSYDLAAKDFSGQ